MLFLWIFHEHSHALDTWFGDLLQLPFSPADQILDLENVCLWDRRVDFEFFPDVILDSRTAGGSLHEQLVQLQYLDLHFAMFWHDTP